MPRPVSGRVRKNYRLKRDALARAQAVLGTKTETETIELALRLVIGDSRAPMSDASAAHRATGHGILKHFGTVSSDDADAMLRAIEDGCERVDNVDEPRW